MTPDRIEELRRKRDRLRSEDEILQIQIKEARETLERLEQERHYWQRAIKRRGN